MHILWHSNAPWVATGYGVQTGLFARRMARDGHHVGVSAFYGLQGSALMWEDGITCYPALFHGYGLDVWDAHAQRHGGDDTVILSLIDAWVLERPKHWWAGWLPVDHEPCPPPVLAKAASMDLAIAMSRFGQAMLAQGGVDAAYVPHGFDPATFYRDVELGQRCRDEWGVPAAAHLTVVVAANKGGWPSRKNLPNQLEGWARFAHGRPDAYLYMHSYPGTDGQMGSCNLVEQAHALGVVDRVRFIDPMRSVLGTPPDYMRGVYSAADVLANVSMGEGFGVPMLEAQACGTPVITGRWTAQAEVVGAGIFVEKDEAQTFWSPQAARMWIAGPAVIAAALDAAYQARGDDRAVAAALRHAEAYEADRVYADYWRPVLERIAEARRPVEARVDVAQVHVGAAAPTDQEGVEA